MSITSKALWFVESHLRSDLSLENVADVTGISRFHLSRAFGEAVGYPFAGYVRARRLSEAAKALACGAPDILDVALEAGYGSHEAFTRAFRQQFGITPEQVRAQANVDQIQLMEPIRMDQVTTTHLAPPRLVKSDALLIFGLAQHYSSESNAGIPSQWERFVPHIGHISGQVGKDAFGVIYNSDDAGSYDYLCGVEVDAFPSEPTEFTRLRIPPQTYAVFQHTDHISAIKSTFKAIWDHGLTDAGYQATDGPAFERYGEQFDGRTGLGGLEIWIPVKA